MGLPVSLMLLTIFFLPSGSSAQKYVASHELDSVLISPAPQMHQPTKSGNVTPLHEEEQPTAAPKIKLDPTQLQQEARELLELSQSLQGDVDSFNHGMLPKDMVEKLKRIQKVAKHLKGEIAP